MTPQDGAVRPTARAGEPGTHELGEKMHTARTRGRRAAVAGLVAIATGIAGVVVGLPAQAAAGDPTGGTLQWGFRESFRSYVGRQTGAIPPIGALPAGQRITLVAPAQLDPAGTPADPTATSSPNETLPYLLPVAGGAVTSADDLTVATAGGVVYAFPSHGFTVTVQDVEIRVVAGTASVVGDLSVVVPEGAAGGHTPGTYGGEDIVLGDVARTDVTLTSDAVTVTGTGVTLTAAGAAALQDFIDAGAPLDDFTLTAQRAAAAAQPRITLSRTSGFDPATTTAVTVTGTGFDPLASVNAGGRPPVAAGQPTGVYVTFGRFADVWRPSAGASSSARPVASQKWALPEPSYTQVGTDYPSQAPNLVRMADDGSFTAELQVAAVAATSGTYGVYVYVAGGGAANPAYELFVPVTFAGDLEVDVTVPQTPVVPDPGTFAWTVAGDGAVSLGTAVAGDTGFTATGALPAITVRDTRPASSGWAITGTAGRFATADGTASFSGARLGWAPTVTGSAAAGAPVAPAASGGLATGGTLASAPAGAPSGDVTVGAGLTLGLPLDTPAGAYTGVLTLTAVG